MFNPMFRVCDTQKRLNRFRLDFVEWHKKIALKKCFLFAGQLSEPQQAVGSVNSEYLRPEIVLSENNRKSFVKKFQAFETSRKLDESENRAAVLVPLCMHKGELGLLYTLRSLKLTANRGQVSFPGGMYDKEDRNLEETALRETWEELKIPREKIDVWGSGNIVGKKNVNVMPIFGYIGEVDPGKLEYNPHEVEEAFVVSLKNLCDLSLCRSTQFRDTYTLPTYLGGKHRVWGFTAAVTHMAMCSLVPEVYKHKVFQLPTIPPKRDKLKTEHRPA